MTTFAELAAMLNTVPADLRAFLEIQEGQWPTDDQEISPTLTRLIGDSWSTAVAMADKETAEGLAEADRIAEQDAGAEAILADAPAACEVCGNVHTR